MGPGELVASSHTPPRLSLIEHARAMLRILGLVIFSSALFGLRLLGRLLGAFAPGLEARWQNRLMRTWARGAARLAGMQVEGDGDPPPAGCLVVANHLSYVDVIALWSFAPGVFVAKSEVASWPLIGRFGRSAQTLFIDRERKRDLLRVIPVMESALRNGERVILFAEGTSSSGAGVLPFKSSLFEAAVRARTPVACAGLSYATPPGSVPAHLSVCWWGDMTFSDHAYRLLGMPGFRATVRFTPKTLTSPERKGLARAARELVEQGFTPSHHSEAGAL